MKKFGVIAITATAISSILWVWSIAKNTTGDTKPSDTNEKVEEKLAVADRFLALAILLSKKEEEQRKLFTALEGGPRMVMLEEIGFRKILV